MARTLPVPTDHRLARRLLCGVSDPSGLDIAFELDGNRVTAALRADESLCGRSHVLPPGGTGAVVDDAAHAAVAALKKRVGMTRETRLRFLKPLYAKDAFRVDATLSLAASAVDVIVVLVRLFNSKEQLCVEADVEVFALTADQVKRMAPDGAVPAELKRYLP